MTCPLEVKQRELSNGAWTSLAGGGLQTLILIILKLTGAYDNNLAVPLTILFTSALGYGVDIVVAKQCFQSWSTGHESILDYSSSGMKKRIAWYTNSLFTTAFVRYLIVTVLDILVITKMSNAATEHLDRHNVMRDSVVRDPLVVLFVGAITFNLFVNVAHFGWVYSVTPDTVTTLLMCIWLVYMLNLPLAKY